jgi:hypothetical protein
MREYVALQKCGGHMKTTLIDLKYFVLIELKYFVFVWIGL